MAAPASAQRPSDGEALAGRVLFPSVGDTAAGRRPRRVGPDGGFGLHAKLFRKILNPNATPKKVIGVGAVGSIFRIPIVSPHKPRKSAGATVFFLAHQDLADVTRNKMHRWRFALFISEFGDQCRFRRRSDMKMFVGAKTNRGKAKNLGTLVLHHIAPKGKQLFGDGDPLVWWRHVFKKRVDVDVFF